MNHSIDTNVSSGYERRGEEEDEEEECMKDE